MAQPAPSNLYDLLTNPGQYLLTHPEDAVGVITAAPLTIIAIILLTIMGTWLVAWLFYRRKVESVEGEIKNLTGRLQLREDENASLTKRRQELTEQLQTVTTKLNEYVRAHDRGFYPTLDRVADGLISFSDLMRKVPIKIVATSEARPFAEQLAAALTSMNYGVLPHEEQTHGIVPARSPHDKIIVRYEEKATHPVHNGVCEGMIAALNSFITCEVSTFPPNGGRDYLQIELLGGL